jgi:hypothetical protein
MKRNSFIFILAVVHISLLAQPYKFIDTVKTDGYIINKYYTESVIIKRDSLGEIESISKLTDNQNTYWFIPFTGEKLNCSNIFIQKDTVFYYDAEKVDFNIHPDSAVLRQEFLFLNILKFYRDYFQHNKIKLKESNKTKCPEEGEFNYLRFEATFLHFQFSKDDFFRLSSIYVNEKTNNNVVNVYFFIGDD